MDNIPKTKIRLESKSLDEAKLNELQKRVNEWHNNGYTSIAIMYYLSKEDLTAIGQWDGHNYIIEVY